MSVPLSFIIPTYNEEKNLQVLLEALRAQLQENDELIIVDSYSQDATAAVAGRMGARVVLQQKLGIGAAKTEGGRQAKNSLLVMLDADSVPAPDFAARIRRHFMDGRLVALAGLGTYESGNPLLNFVYNCYSMKVFCIGMLLHMLTGKYWLPANNCVICRELFLSVGGYRSVVCEDNDLMKRLPASRLVKYDRKLIVRLSDRRFRENGFLRTLLLWLIADVKVWLGKGTEAAHYRN